MKEIRFAENVKTLRQGRNLTQAELAKKLGFNKNSIIRWEQNTSDPSLFNAAVIADYLGLTLDELCFKKFE